MLNVTIEIWPFGDINDRTAIAHVAIWNKGTYYEDDVQYADYGYAVTEEFDDRFFDTIDEPLTEVELRDIARLESFDDDRIRAHGVIWKHPRRAGATVLLGRVLADVAERETGPPV